MSSVRPELVEGLCFDRLSTNELANKSGRINNNPAHANKGGMYGNAIL